MTRFYERLSSSPSTLPPRNVSWLTRFCMLVARTPFRSAWEPDTYICQFTSQLKTNLNEKSGITTQSKWRELLLMGLLQLIAFKWDSAIWLWGLLQKQKQNRKRLNYNLGNTINHNYDCFAASLWIHFWLSFAFLAKDVVSMQKR